MKNTTEVPNEVIIDAHKEACQKWKTIIEGIAPELFKSKYNDGDWVINGFNHIHKIGYDYFGKKTCLYDFNLLYYNEIHRINVRLATPSEIESHLIKEAKKRMFRVGVRVNAKVFGDDWYSDSVLNKPDFEYRGKIDQLSLGSYAIYSNGKWATIISEPLELTLDEIAKKFGVDAVKIKK